LTNLPLGRGRRTLAGPALLLALSLTCSPDTPVRRSGPPSTSHEHSASRITQPLLSGFNDWRPCKTFIAEGAIVESAECGAINLPPDLVSVASGECDRLMNTQTEAVRILAYVPQCTDAAVEKLETLPTPATAAALSDLAGAYYVRAQRKDQPSDLVRSLNAAERAVRLAPDLPEAQFNQALAQEALGLLSEALHSWSALRAAPSPWKAESEQHWRRLLEQRALSAAVQWPLDQQRLPEAVRSGDRVAVMRLVAPHRGAAQRHVEEAVIPAWALASAQGRTNEAQEALTLAEAISAALARQTGDRYLLDSVELIRAADTPAKRQLLQNGQLALRDARLRERQLKNEAAGDEYARARLAFSRVGSPLRFGAMLGRSTAYTFTRDFTRALALLHAVELAAQARHYPYLLARVHSGRGFVFTVQGRYLDALAEYSEAQAIFEHTDDRENLSNVYARKIGLLRTIGEQELTWREICRARGRSSSMFEAQSRHLLLGESALSAAELGYPAVAIHYQNEAVTMLEEELARNRDPERAVGLRRNLGVALRGRAAIRMRLNDYPGSKSDLDFATVLTGAENDPGDAAILGGFRARLAEISAQAMARFDRKKAITDLTDAIQYSSQTHYHTLIASLLLQRAELQRMDGNRPAELQDLRSGIAALDRERKLMFGGGRHSRSQSDDLWSAYFSRSQEAYRRLIRHLVDDGSDAEAFEYAERARMLEPAALLPSPGGAHDADRPSSTEGEPLRLAEVERGLRPGAFLLEYCVLDDRTYVWIVRHGSSARYTLPVGDREIGRWTSALQQFAFRRDVGSFDASLAAPYDALLRAPLTSVAKQRLAGARPRLILVPDRSMHGLPFAALRNGRRFVVQDHAVSVAASATLYMFSLAQDERRSRLKATAALLIADPAFNTRLDVTRGLLRLRGARREVDRIERIYAPALRVERRMDAQATVADFLKLASRSSIIHLAVHGVTNPDAPTRSFFLLAPAGSDSGVLDAKRLLQQARLDQTRLAVLAACSSAGGIPVGVDGLAPLLRPIVAAGVPAVVGTLWDVSDQATTEELLVRFHQHYREGYDADEALRLAQVEMLEDPDLGRRSPWAWAPFQLIGYASSPFPHRLEPRRR
jgi:CHAT domain-containing protein